MSRSKKPSPAAAAAATATVNDEEQELDDDGQQLAKGVSSFIAKIYKMSVEVGGEGRVAAPLLCALTNGIG
jgi:hypothetical protein